MTSQEIANIIRYIRKESGLSQSELATLAGVGKTVVFDIEKGKETIQLSSLQKILAVLNIQLKLETPLETNYEKSTN